MHRTRVHNQSQRVTEPRRSRSTLFRSCSNVAIDLRSLAKFARETREQGMVVFAHRLAMIGMIVEYASWFIRLFGALTTPLADTALRSNLTRTSAARLHGRR